MPLAAVWLVAASIIAATYPIKTHAIVVDLPASYPGDYLGPLTPTANLLALDAQGTILWNGVEVDEAQLRDILRGSLIQNPQSALLFEPDGATAYGEAIALLDIVRQEGLIDRCFIFANTARYRQYDNPESWNEPVPYSPRDCAPYW